MAMDTAEAHTWRELVDLIAEGVKSGRLKIEPEYDGNQHIIAFHVVPNQPDPRRAHRSDTRKARPL